MGHKTSSTEAHLKDKRFVEVKPNVFIKSDNPIKSFIKKIEVPGSNYRGKKKSKYNVADKADRTYNGTVYDSKLEMQYRQHLDLLVKDGAVKTIWEQSPYNIIVNEVLICKYFADFVVHYADGRTEHIDVKGIRTPLFKLKKKLVEALSGVKIKEVKKGDF